MIGATETGARLVLGLQMGDKESASNWREFFKDLKRRGLDADKIVMGIMNSLPGPEKVFKEAFPKAKGQRCQVHGPQRVAKGSWKVQGGRGRRDALDLLCILQREGNDDPSPCPHPGAISALSFWYESQQMEMPAAEISPSHSETACLSAYTL